MIQEKLKSIEERINSSASMKKENKEAILKLLSELQSEFDQVETEKTDQIASLESLGKLETEEDEGLIKSAFNEVSDSIKEFEENHPKLIQVVNSICTQLSNAGL